MVALLGSTPRSVLPPVTWAAFKLLVKEPRSRDEVGELLLPSSLRPDGGRPESALIAVDALVGLGLVTERQGELRVDPKCITDSEIDNEDWYRKELRARVLATARNKDL